MLSISLHINYIKVTSTLQILKPITTILKIQNLFVPRNIFMQSYKCKALSKSKTNILVIITDKYKIFHYKRDFISK